MKMRSLNEHTRVLPRRIFVILDTLWVNPRQLNKLVAQ